MDRLVDQADAAGAIEKTGPSDRDRDHDDDLSDDGPPIQSTDQADIQAELYCSTREMGIAAVAFGPVGEP